MSEPLLEAPATQRVDEAGREPVADAGAVTSPPARSIVANVASLATSQVITWSLAIVWIMAVPRLVGPDGMGLLVIATSVTSLVAVVLSLPPKDYVVRQMVADRGDASRLLVTTLIIRIAMLPLLLAAASAYGYVAELDAYAMLVLYLMVGATACGMLMEPALATFQGTERMQYIAYTDVANKSVQTLGAVVLAVAGFGVAALTGFGALVALFVLLLSLLWAHRIIGVRAKPVAFGPVLRGGMPYWFVALFFVAYLWADGFLLGILVPTDVVGWYGAATRLFTTMMFLSVVIATASLPRLIAAHAEGPERLLQVAKAPFEWVVILGVPIGVGLASIADEVVPFLYGPQFSGAVPALVVLGLGLPLMYVNIMISQLFVASGRPMTMARVLGAAAVVNVTLNLVLIPFSQTNWGNGAIGAATSLLVTELFQVTVSIAIIGRNLLGRSTVFRIAKASLAAVGMAAVLAALDGAAFPAQVLVGAGVFALLSILLRLPTTQEWDMARQGLVRIRGSVRASRKRGE